MMAARRPALALLVKDVIREQILRINWKRVISVGDVKKVYVDVGPPTEPENIYIAVEAEDATRIYRINITQVRRMNT